MKSKSLLTGALLATITILALAASVSYYDSITLVSGTGQFTGNGAGLSNAVAITAGSGVSVTPSGNGRSFAIAATGGGGGTSFPLVTDTMFATNKDFAGLIASAIVRTNWDGVNNQIGLEFNGADGRQTTLGFGYSAGNGTFKVGGSNERFFFDTPASIWGIQNIYAAGSIGTATLSFSPSSRIFYGPSGGETLKYNQDNKIEAPSGVVYHGNGAGLSNAVNVTGTGGITVNVSGNGRTFQVDGSAISSGGGNPVTNLLVFQSLSNTNFVSGNHTDFTNGSMLQTNLSTATWTSITNGDLTVSNGLTRFYFGMTNGMFWTTNTAISSSTNTVILPGLESIDGTLWITNDNTASYMWVSNGAAVFTNGVSGNFINLSLGAGGNGVAPTNMITIQEALSTAPSNAIAFVNPTAATTGAQKVSPSTMWEGQGFATTGSTSGPVRFRTYVQPVQGAANATGNLLIESSVANGAWVNIATFTSAGVWTAPSAFNASAVNVTGTSTLTTLTTGTGDTTIGSGGIANNGGGFKHARVTTGSINAASSAVVTVTWGTTFADANYTVSATVQDSTAAALSLQVVHIEAVNATDVQVRVQNTSAGALTGTLHVIAVHD